MKKYDWLIVGAGLYGATFAQQAMQNGQTCLVVEKRSHIAGNAYTVNVEGIEVHRYGAHIFHTNNREVWEYVNRFAEFNHFINSPLAHYNGEFYNLPFNMNTFRQMWGITTPKEARQMIEQQKETVYANDPQNLEQQALNLVGLEIYEKLIKGYTEKQWGRPCHELPAFIIKRVPLRFTYDNNYFDARYQGIPIGGYTKMVANMLRGADIQLNTDYLINKDDLDICANHVLYTGALDAYFDYKLGYLTYRSLHFEIEALEEENYQGCAVVNYTDAKKPYTRIIEHKHFVFGKQPKTVISREYPMPWQPGEEAYYSVNDLVNNELCRKYVELAKKEFTIFGGRLAEYRYYDMDTVIEMALQKYRFCKYKDN